MLGRSVCLLVLATAVTAGGVAAQPGQVPEPYMWEFNPLIGFRLGNDFELEAPGEEGGPAGDASIGGSANYGMVVSRRVSDSGWLELVWDFQPTRGRVIVQSETTSVTERFDLRVHNIQVGGRAETSQEGARPFASAAVGFTIYDAPGRRGSDTRFGVNATLGATFDLSRRVGVRLQARGWLVALASASSVWCTLSDETDPRRRCSVPVGSRSVAQADISTGLSIRL